MKYKDKFVLLLLTVCSVACAPAHSQARELEHVLKDLEREDIVRSDTFDKADPVLERLVKSSNETVTSALPVITHAAKNSHLPVRRAATLALYEITTRPDSQTLLARETATLSALLTDIDIPIRRMTGLAINNLRLEADSPLVSVLEVYLAREDSVSTIGAGVAGLLMQAAPSRADSTSAVVQFMRRKDQTSRSRLDTLQSIRVARSHNREIGKEVAAYADDLDEQTSINALETLQDMGKSIVLDNQQQLSRIAATSSKPLRVRAAATKALSIVQ